MRLRHAALMILLSACAAPEQGATDRGSTATLTTTDLPATGPGLYALWLSDGAGDVELAGTFRDNEGVDFEAEGLSAWSEAFVTVELREPTTPGPAVILRGTVTEDGVDLALALDIRVEGGVTLWTPTDDEPDNHTQGAWFMERVGDGAEAALTLDSPAEGWVFTGWVGTQDHYLPMGSFTSAEGSDSDCFFCGDGEVGGVPGEDFVARLPPEIERDIDLADGASSVVLSISPGAYDISPGAYDLESGDPFRYGFDVLSVDVPESQAGGELMELGSVLVTPSATLTF